MDFASAMPPLVTSSQLDVAEFLRGKRPGSSFRNFASHEYRADLLTWLSLHHSSTDMPESRHSSIRSAHLFLRLVSVCVTAPS